VRTGMIAVKCGMTMEWDEYGRRLPLTVLWFDGNEVVQARTPLRDGYAALQVTDPGPPGPTHPRGARPPGGHGLPAPEAPRVARGRGGARGPAGATSHPPASLPRVP